MPFGYEKFDNIEDSGDEQDSSVTYQRARCSDESDDLRKLTTRLDFWLKKRINVLKSEAREADRKLNERVARVRRTRESSAASAGGGFGSMGLGFLGGSFGNYSGYDSGFGGRHSSFDDAAMHLDGEGASGLDPATGLGEADAAQLPVREVTESERQVLARFLAVSHFPDGSHNLHRHVEILELGRHHRWLEEDPGCLRLLCRLHISVLKSGSPSEEDRRMGREEKRHRSPQEREEDQQFQECLLCAVNMLAAPKQAKLVGGMLELVQVICTPATPQAKELRRKYEMKEFAKDALFESLFPSMAKDGKDDEDDRGWWELALFCILIIIVIAALAVGIYLLRDGHLEKSPKGDRLGVTTSTTTPAPLPEMGPSLPVGSAGAEL